jgi:hypothetical protein
LFSFFWEVREVIEVRKVREVMRQEAPHAGGFFISVSMLSEIHVVEGVAEVLRLMACSGVVILVAKFLA